MAGNPIGLRLSWELRFSANIVITTTGGLPDQDLVFYLLCQEPGGEAESLFYLERTRYVNNVEICWRENAADEKKSLECGSRLHIFGQSAVALFYRWLSNTGKSQTSLSTCHLKCNRACQSWQSTQMGVLVHSGDQKLFKKNFSLHFHPSALAGTLKGLRITFSAAGYFGFGVKHPEVGADHRNTLTGITIHIGPEGKVKMRSCRSKTLFFCLQRTTQVGTWMWKMCYVIVIKMTPSLFCFCCHTRAVLQPNTAFRKLTLHF